VFTVGENHDGLEQLQRQVADVLERL